MLLRLILNHEYYHFVELLPLLILVIGFTATHGYSSHHIYELVDRIVQWITCHYFEAIVSFDEVEV